MLKYFFLIITASVLCTLSAVDMNDERFPFIQPVSVEKKSLIKTNSHGNLNTVAKIKDDDNDGVSNIDDRCPKTEIGSDVDATGCEPDADADGVKDILDECADTGKEFIVDSVGCPQADILKISFKKSKSVIAKDDFAKIEKFAEFLQENNGYQAIIYGYSSSKENSKELSQSRAKSVMDALLKYKIKLTRLTAIGMGSKNPIVSDDTQEAHAQNRRVEVEILK